jgi:uncharacterized protein
MDPNERQWGMLCHLAALLQFVGPSLGNIIGPLIVWLIKKDEYPFVDEQGKESLNFQISMTLYMWVASLALVLTCVGLIIIPVVFAVLTLVDVIFMIVAAIKASGGESYRYPMTIRFLK